LVSRFAAYCNHAVEMGIPATIVGFSFNATPRRPAIHALSHLHPDVRVNVRDQASLDRFTRIVGIPAALCADVAFLMAPASEPEPDIENWIGQMRAVGRIPVGININAHAFSVQIARTGAATLAANIARQLAAAGDRNKLAYLLIPHDVKRQSGDITLLRSLEESLRSAGFPHVRYALMDNPARIKRIAGLLDLMVTGRMHLAIASLGMKTPVLSIEYQDKFEGLYRHVGLAADDMIDPAQCLSDELAMRISSAIARRDDTRRTITANLPRVADLAIGNLCLGG